MSDTLRRWGNSLAVRIPYRLARSARLTEGSAVDVQLERGRIVITPLSPLPTLEQLLSGVRQGNLHGDFRWTPTPLRKVVG
jgi:antitoxin MazE